MNAPTDRATLPLFAYVPDPRTGLRHCEFIDTNGERYNPPRPCNVLPVVAQANVAKVLAEAAAELIAARDACGEMLDADDPANAERIRRAQLAWVGLREALAAAGLK